MLAFKIITERDQVDGEKFFQLWGNDRTKGHVFKLRKTGEKKECGREETLLQPDSSGQLERAPSEIVSKETFAEFERRVDAFLKK